MGPANSYHWYRLVVLEAGKQVLLDVAYLLLYLLTVGLLLNAVDVSSACLLILTRSQRLPTQYDITQCRKVIVHWFSDFWGQLARMLCNCSCWQVCSFTCAVALWIVFVPVIMVALVLGSAFPNARHGFLKVVRISVSFVICVFLFGVSFAMALYLTPASSSMLAISYSFFGVLSYTYLKCVILYPFGLEFIC